MLLAICVLDFWWRRSSSSSSFTIKVVHNCVELFLSSAAHVLLGLGWMRLLEWAKQEFWLLFAFVYARRTNYLFVWLKLFFVCAFLAKTCAFFLFHKAQFAWIYSLFRCVLGLAQNVRTIKPKTTSSSSHTIKVQSKIIICLIIRRFGHLFLHLLPSTHRHCSRHWTTIICVFIYLWCGANPVRWLINTWLPSVFNGSAS